MMETRPCRRCGSTKTGSVRRELLSKMALTFGYSLRECGGCHRLRLVPRQHEGEPETIRQPVSKLPAPPPGENIVGCPYCGSTDFHRSRRRWYDRLMKRPTMARCRICRRRFPRPYIPSAPVDSVARESA